MQINQQIKLIQICIIFSTDNNLQTMGQIQNSSLNYSSQANQRILINSATRSIKLSLTELRQHIFQALLSFDLIIIFQKMQKLQNLKNSYHQIINQHCPINIKKLLLESIRQQLTILQNSNKQNLMELSINSCIKNDNTFSTLTSPSLLSHQEIDQQNTINAGSFLASDMSQEQLQLKIVQKQKMKCFLNEEIQTLEDDFYERQKIFLTKKDVCEELDGQIARKSHEIMKTSCQKSITAFQDDKKSLTSRIKSFFKK